MKIYCWPSPSGNFGDDLNRFLWNHFIPNVLHGDSDILLVGIGTVLSDALPKARLRIVLGAGLGYGQFPKDIHAGGWRIFAVRGPLTAQAVGRPELAATDPAALLPLLPEFHATKRSGVAFVPHWTTAANPRWQEASRQAKVEFIDPRNDAKDVIRRIAGATMVIAESMHGAIVADAFRVPWIPIVSTQDAPLKWHDWTLSLGMQYHPVRVSNLSRTRRTIADKFYRRIAAPSAVTRNYEQQVQAELSAFLERTENTRPSDRRKSKSNLRVGLTRLLDNVTYPLIIEHAAETLHALAKLEPMLSSDVILKNKQAMLLKSIDALRRDHEAGQLAAL